MAKTLEELEKIERSSDMDKYLFSIASGDLRDIPTEPSSRAEEYLEYLAHNGGTGSGDLSPTDREKINKIPIIEQKVNQNTSQLDETNTQITDLDNRISTIVAHNGDGTKDTEVIDARNGSISLKDRIDLVDITEIKKSKNLFNIGDPNYVPNGYYTSTGEFKPSTTQAETGYIEVSPNQDITYNIVEKQNVYWYDSNKQYVSLTQGSVFQTNGYVTAPSNAKYVRFIFIKSFIDNFQIELGRTPSEYEIHGDYKKIKENIKLSNSQVLEAKELISQGIYGGKKLLFMGDSITAIGDNERGWVRYFNQIIKPSSFINVASSGATWCDYIDTPTYDGNPIAGENNLNVLGNQLQKIINNNYETPDIIMIAAGTNDNLISMTDDEIELEFYKDNNNLPLVNVNRKNFAGAMRYVAEKLREKYPDVQIFICTPIQRCNVPNRNNYPIIKSKGETIKKVAKHLSIPVIDSMECGVYGVNGINGQITLDYNDGLHLSTVGAKKLGFYNARKVANWFCF